MAEYRQAYALRSPNLHAALLAIQLSVSSCLLGAPSEKEELKESSDASVVCRQGRHPSRIQKCISAVAKGDGAAAYVLADIYRFGREGVLADSVEATKWYMAAAKLNGGWAYAEVGRRLLCADGVEKNDVQARDWFKSGVEHSGYTSLSWLALMYEEGIGGPQDNDSAFGLYRRAAEFGDPIALFRLGIEEATVSPSVTSQAVFKRAEQNFIEASEVGMAWRLAMGQIVRDSHHRMSDEDEALRVKQFRFDFDETGSGEAAYGLGQVYFLGHGVKKDLRLSFRWFLVAAESGHGYSAYNVAQMLARGLGTEKDSKAAVGWLHAAARQGIPRAMFALGWFILNGIGIEPNPSKGFELIRTAAELGHDNAEEILGLLYAEGRGVKQDLVAAKKWWRHLLSCEKVKR